MMHSTAIIPHAEDIHAAAHGPADDPIYVIRIGPAIDCCTIHVPDRPTLDALAAALDEIRDAFAERGILS